MDWQLPVSQETLRAVSQLDRFRGVWASGTLVPPDRLSRMMEAARIQSAASSCRLAGIHASDTEVASLARGETVAIRDGAELVGYWQALGRKFPEGPIPTSEELRRLHAVVMGTTEPGPAGSCWRQVPLHLEAFDREGRAMGRVFQTLPPRLVPEKTEALLTWLEIELRTADQHPLFVIGAFMLAFLAASPFARGNGRMARLLAVHLLARAGYVHLPYASFERVIEEMRDDYYDAVDAAETKLWTHEADVTPWLRFFLDALLQHRDRVSMKVDLERRALELSPLQRTILDTVREHGTASASLLMAATGSNRNTLKDNLRKLVDQQWIERIGRRRGTFYRMAGEEPSRQDESANPPS
jgi:Fic family protein